VEAVDQMASAPSVFQPGFHQALRLSVATSGDVTLRVRLPIGRGGSSLRVSWVSGDAGLQIYAAQVVNAAGVTQPLRFSGADGVQLAARQRVTSDPVSLDHLRRQRDPARQRHRQLSGKPGAQRTVAR
jgi:hypothetical protein